MLAATSAPPSRRERESLAIIEVALYRISPERAAVLDVKLLARVLGHSRHRQESLPYDIAAQMRAHFDALRAHPHAIPGWAAEFDYRSNRRVATLRRVAPRSPSDSPKSPREAPTYS
jgi:hypothetical protein